jgi:CO/xanthine dehydrogenase FAD-binding subunit
VGTDYVVARDVVEAVRLKAEGHTVLAGGTDHYPVRVGRSTSSEPVVDITGIPGLRGIARDGDVWRFGALTRWADVVRCDLPRGFDALRDAARDVGAVQVQNAGTIAGNLVTASPAGDGIPSFLALDASVEVVGPAGARVLPLGEFITGYRATVLGPDELVTAILVPASVGAAGSAFLKLGLRRYLVISVVMVAAQIEARDGAIAAARVAVGACSPVAQRLPGLEAALVGRSVGEDLATLVTAEHLAPLTPIDDVRATAEYRLGAARTLVGRAVVEAAGRSS